jgi:hypothetical protein
VKDYYSILGVHRNASEADIKRAYRRLAVTYHPDKNKDPLAQEIFVEITEAYDVIGDPVKRQGYNQILDSPFRDVQVAEAPRHKDPAYRRKRSAASPSKKPFSDSYYLMREYLKYFKWAGRIGILVSALFFIDYLLPYRTVTENIREIYEVRGRRNSTSHNVLVTGSGKKIKLYNGQAGPFFNQPAIVGEYTLIYSTPMLLSTSTETYRVRLAYMYGGLILFPLGLFITSLLGILYKDRVEFCFNVNLVSGLFLIIFLILI